MESLSLIDPKVICLDALLANAEMILIFHYGVICTITRNILPTSILTVLRKNRKIGVIMWLSALSKREENSKLRKSLFLVCSRLVTVF